MPSKKITEKERKKCAFCTNCEIIFVAGDENNFDTL